VAHHKRRKPKNKRAGCLWCKPHKHQRAKDCFDSKTVQEKRELQDELPPPARKSRKKNTRRWCRGKEGVPHKPAWIDKGRWWHYRDFAPRYHSEWQLVCTECGKQLGYYYRWGRPPHVVIHKFPGWEQFKDGPPLAQEAR
jgi:hypothetical protein